MDSKWTTNLLWVSLSIAQYCYAYQNISCFCWKLTAKTEFVVTRCLPTTISLLGLNPGLSQRLLNETGNDDFARESYNSSCTHDTKLSRQQASSLHGQQQLRAQLRGTAVPHSCRADNVQTRFVISYRKTLHKPYHSADREETRDVE